MRRDSRPRRLAHALVVTHLCLYLPFLWLVCMEYPWSAYRWQWIRMWPILPGLLAAIPFHPNDGAEFLAMACGASALIALFTAIGGRGRIALVASGALALAVSGVTSWFAYQVFRF